MATGEIPKSTALAEAAADSLSELMGRDPETLTATDEDRMIEAFRAQRQRWAQAEAEPKTRQSKTASSKAAGLIASAKPDDLGI